MEERESTETYMVVLRRYSALAPLRTYTTGLPELSGEQGPPVAQKIQMRSQHGFTWRCLYSCRSFPIHHVITHSPN